MAIKNVKGPVPPFKMKIAPTMPSSTTTLSLNIYDGMCLSDIIDDAKKIFGDEYLKAILSLEVECGYYGDESDTVNAYFTARVPNKGHLEQYQKDLAEYEQWKKEYAQEIKAFNAEKNRKAKESKKKALEKQEELLAQQLENIRKQKDKL